MVNDTIADTLIRIKNGYGASKKSVSVPKSKLSLAICQLLAKEGYLASVSAKDRELTLELKYEQSLPAISDLDRVSKPSLRIYVGKDKLPKVLGGKGISVISTSEGIMTDREARKKGLGGELICKVW